MREQEFPIKPMANKYHNIISMYQGIVFDSKKEMARYKELYLLEKAGIIKNIELQPTYVLQKGFTDKKGIKYRPITYRADFRYYDVKLKETIVEDVKGKKTRTYQDKKKLLLFNYPDINFYEIE